MDELVHGLVAGEGELCASAGRVGDEVGGVAGVEGGVGAQLFGGDAARTVPVSRGGRVAVRSRRASWSRWA
ncbi:hypothetical protein [Nesterenkonia pannonica]|uniref:hypothetical protein n=1 Tax=Nesterenkonia pannonica TaxID=1548602 RepID=UPI002164675F|nr:hypothetical protein [Nesterenkonia pannonica]